MTVANIENANLKLKTRQDGKIILPSQMENEEYIGPIHGYYVGNTNIFNVIPNDTPEAVRNDSRIRHLGYVLPLNPFRFLKDCGETAAPGSLADLIRRQMEGAAPEPKPFIFDEKQLMSALTESLSACDDAEAIITWVVDVLVKKRPGNHVIGYRENGALEFRTINDSIEELTKETYSLKLDVFSRNTGILESDIMLTKGAVFIGCGSVGSLFALELARAGVGRFLLIDSDVFGYHNICRHQCGIYDVGRFKTDALHDRILQINPYAKVVRKNMRIQDVPLDDLMAFCDKNTIVIGGADNREGDLYANGIAQEVGMPFMSLGCWERAFAGEIFYCLPTGMPNYQDFMEVAGHMSARVNQNRKFYTTEAELEKVSFEPGISADINFVTTIGVKLALDLLNRDNENYTQRLLPHLTQYTLVCNTNSTKVGGEMAEIFSYPLQVTTSIIIPYSKKE